MWLIALGGLLYTISLHQFAYHSPVAGGSGIQGMIETFCDAGSFLCVLVGTWGQGRTFKTSGAVLCFAIFGLFSLSSAWRSFSPSLSSARAALFLLIIATIYLVSQAQVAQEYLVAVYRSYVALLVIGIGVGLVLPSLYPLVSSDEFTGRTRLGVFDTAPGMLGEQTALLLLLAPLLQGRVGRLSQVFLFGFNVACGGKTNTALLCFLLLVRAVVMTKRWRSWRGVTVMGCATCLLAIGALSLGGTGSEDSLLAKPAEAIYGHQIGKDATSLDGRAALWATSMELLPQAQLLGFGFNGVREILLKTAAWSGSSHNGYLEMALTSGLIGFAFFIGAIVLVVRSCLRAPPSMRLYLGSVVIFILIVDLIGSDFSFPACFGSMVLAWIYYQAERSRIQSVAARVAFSDFHTRLRTALN